MKKLIVALVLLFVLVVSVVSCSCDCPFQDCAETTADTTKTPAETSSAVTGRKPIYDTDERWGDLIPMKPVK